LRPIVTDVAYVVYICVCLPVGHIYYLQHDEYHPALLRRFCEYDAVARDS